MAKARGKSKIQKKLDLVKKVLKEGTKDKVIQAFDDYKNLAKLEKDLESMKARVEAAKAIQANEEERIKAAAKSKES